MKPAIFASEWVEGLQVTVAAENLEVKIAKELAVTFDVG
jgi:hypothetical protein